MKSKKPPPVTGGKASKTIVEWCDQEGNLKQRKFDRLEDAQLEAAYLETKYDTLRLSQKWRFNP